MTNGFYHTNKEELKKAYGHWNPILKKANSRRKPKASKKTVHKKVIGPSCTGPARIKSINITPSKKNKTIWTLRLVITDLLNNEEVVCFLSGIKHYNKNLQDM